jgi:hypothetical protein
MREVSALLASAVAFRCLSLASAAAAAAPTVGLAAAPNALHRLVRAIDSEQQGDK